MKMNALAYASVDRLALINLRIEDCAVPARHRYTMPPVSVERFVYITRGSVCFFLGNTQLQAGAWDMVYLPGGTAYRSQWQEASEFTVIDLLLHDAENQPIRFGEAPSILFHDTHASYRGLLEELAVKADATGPFDWLERLSLSFRLLCQMARDTNRAELSEHNRRIKEGLTYLQNNYTADFSVEELARMCCLSVGAFRRSFGECVGMSPVEYRNRLRIQKAVTLLKTGKYTVGETAEAVGIRDIKYFSKLFKRYTGVTPRVIKGNWQ